MIKRSYPIENRPDNQDGFLHLYLQNKKESFCIYLK